MNSNMNRNVYLLFLTAMFEVIKPRPLFSIFGQYNTTRNAIGSFLYHVNP